MRIALVMLVAAAAACAPRGASVEEREPAREQARALLAAHCGSCHIASKPTARRDALAIYDLEEKEWSARLSDEQLANALFRLGEPLAPDGSPNDVTDAERDAFRRYVEAEKAARAMAPACPPEDVLGAVHDAAFHLEHGGDAGGDLRRAASAIAGPLDGTTRSLLLRLARAEAAGGDATRVTEEVRAQLAGWRCLGEEQHRRLHAALPPL